MKNDFDFDDFIDYDGQANLPPPDQTDTSHISAVLFANNAINYKFDDIDAQNTMPFDTFPGSTAQ